MLNEILGMQHARKYLADVDRIFRARKPAEPDGSGRDDLFAGDGAD